MQSLFHQPAVKPFKRTRIISGLTHCQHESLGSQGTALVYADTYVSFAYLAHYGMEQTYALRQGFAEKSQQTEEARIDKRNQLRIIQFLLPDAFPLLSGRTVASDIVLLKCKYRLCVLPVLVLSGDKYDNLLCRTCCQLVQTGMRQFLQYIFVRDMISFPKLHIRTCRS